MVTKHLQDEWLAYADGRLEPAAQARLAEHLAGCGACRERADEWSRLADELGAMPAALRAVPSRARTHWPEVWGRVQRAGGRTVPAAGRLAPRLTVYLSLVAVTLSAGVAWPGTLEGGANAVTAGVVETPRAAAHTPQAVMASGTKPSLTPPGTAPVAGQLATLVGPAPAETPVPGKPG